MSKSEYEDRMEDILENAKKQLEPVHNELSSLLSAAMTKENKEKIKNLSAKQENILEEVKERIDKISPPDDFFVGHSSIVEFLELLIKSQRLTRKTFNGSNDNLRAEILETFQASNQAYSRALRELAFLDYELKQTFDNTLLDTRTQIQQLFQPVGGVESTKPGEKGP